MKNIIGKRNVVINLKDAHSVIASPRDAYINTVGNQGMAKAGMGDILAGLTAGLWAQGMSAFDSTACAAWMNGKMGEKISKKKWYAYATRDLLDELGKIKKKK